MEKKALQLASVASMIDQFNMSNIQILQSLGYKVDVVADFTNPGTITIERANDLKKRLNNMEVRVIDIPIPRSLNPRLVLQAYKKVRKILLKENYSIIHCHSPIGGAIARLAAKSERKSGTKLIYTAHGFHFFKGAPIRNWIVFYPIEKWLSKYTDVLVTINKEDYNRAFNSFFAKKTIYVPGVGVDTRKFKACEIKREKIRKELQLDNDRIMILSVGELNENKNHEAVIQALSGLDLTYVIVGKGDLKERLASAAKICNVDLRLMGFRTDVSDFYSAADSYVLPSKREGLNVSLIEAMSSGLPCAASRIRGNTDLIDEPLFDPTNDEEIRSSIIETIENKIILGTKNIEKAKLFDTENINKIMEKIYKSL